jgi:sec-independent protein translocase protein TatC
MQALENKGKKNEKEMSFLEHLEELRWHIIRSVIAIFVLMIVAFCLRNIIFNVIIFAPRSPEFITARLLCNLGAKLSEIFSFVNPDVLCINQRPANLISVSMAGQLTAHIKVSLVAGLILAFPVILWEFWRFFEPALKPNEKRYTQGTVLISSSLFFVGVVFGYFALAPLSVHFLTGYEISEVVVNQIDIRSYIKTVTSMCFATGIIFEFPIIAYFLTKIGVLTPEFMRTYRKHAIVVILILSAIITPPDVFSQILVAIPLLALYEVSIYISARIVKKREAERAAFMNDDDTKISNDKSLVHETTH